ncbi:MAG: hypothetical protein V2A54_06295 [Bacteroidota bacterium]
MRKSLLLVAFALPFLTSVNAQNSGEKKFGISFSGFVKNDVFYDTRQATTIREGHFLLYPTNASLDADGVDINAKPSFNILSIQSRLTGKITAPDAFGAKTSGVLEADFFGNENASFIDVNGFRLRHAFVKLAWKKRELLMGQYWHPLFIASSFPGTISFNTGAPFEPFSRNPQVRFTQKCGKFNAMAAILSQRDFISPGGSSLALRNAGLPEGQVQLSYENKNDSLKKEFVFGIGGGYKMLTPRLYSEVTTAPAAYNLDTNTWTVTYIAPKTKKYAVTETVAGYSAEVFAKIKMPKFTVKWQGIYGQNLFDLVMLGGYAVSDTLNSATQEKEYTPVNTLSTWLDMNTNGKKIQVGLFGGYTQNMGTDKVINVNDNFANTSRGSNILYVYRVAPRVVFIAEKLQLATEVEYTNVAYGSKIDNKGIVSNCKNYSNIRVLFSAIYSF